jgi:hypothetical protein
MGWQAKSDMRTRQMSGSFFCVGCRVRFIAPTPRGAPFFAASACQDKSPFEGGGAVGGGGCACFLSVASAKGDFKRSACWRHGAGASNAVGIPGTVPNGTNVGPIRAGYPFIRLSESGQRQPIFLWTQTQGNPTPFLSSSFPRKRESRIRLWEKNRRARLGKQYQRGSMWGRRERRGSIWHTDKEDLDSRFRGNDDGERGCDWENLNSAPFGTAPPSPSASLYFVQSRNPSGLWNDRTARGKPEGLQHTIAQGKARSATPWVPHPNPHHPVGVKQQKSGTCSKRRTRRDYVYPDFAPSRNHE